MNEQFFSLLQGGVTGKGADRTWTYTPAECTCTNETDDEEGRPHEADCPYVAPPYTLTIDPLPKEGDSG